MGAAIQGGVLRGDVKDILLLDVTPLRWVGGSVPGLCTCQGSAAVRAPRRRARAQAALTRRLPATPAAAWASRRWAA
jgi:molecular chaperone DnaK (HSP70)